MTLHIGGVGGGEPAAGPAPNYNEDDCALNGNCGEEVLSDVDKEPPVPSLIERYRTERTLHDDNTTSGLTSAVLVLKPGFVKQSKTYIVSLTVIDDGALCHCSVALLSSCCRNCDERDSARGLPREYGASRRQLQHQH